VRELGAGRGRDDLTVDARFAPAVLQHDPADAAIGHQHVGAAAQDEDRELVLPRHLDRVEKILVAGDTKEEIRGSADPQ